MGEKEAVRRLREHEHIIGQSAGMIQGSIDVMIEVDVGRALGQTAAQFENRVPLSPQRIVMRLDERLAHPVIAEIKPHARQYNRDRCLCCESEYDRKPPGPFGGNT